MPEDWIVTPEAARAAGSQEAAGAVGSPAAGERLDHFMARVMPGYYATRDPFKDFTTAPEIGQVFGELVGAWAAVAWHAMGAPDPVLLVEAGPGRGTLMRDALRAVGRVAPGFAAACRVHFIETSPSLRAAQAERVPGATWHDGLETVPAGPAIVLANEFLDALPMQQFEFRDGVWMERHVREGAFVLVPSARDFSAWGPVEEGAVAEENVVARGWVADVAARIVAQGGAALIADYGRLVPGFGDTLKALGGNKVVADRLARPGEVDLSAHVDFADMAAAARAAGAAVHGPVTQGAFLLALGLRVRTEQLAAANPERAAGLRGAADRLSSAAWMGELFKVMAITRPGMAAPPGFGGDGG
jgi:SAM-dependent MidA family methyltransferase